MKITRFPILFFAMAAMIALFAGSCGNKNAEATFGVTNVLKKIPADAAAVAVVNVGTLMNKLDYADFKKTELFKRMLQEAKSDELKKILENPETSGIATNGQFCMFVDFKGEKDVSVSFLLPIKNVKDLEAIFEKSAKEKADSPFKKIEDAKDFKYVSETKDDTKMGIAWDKKMLTFTVSSSSEVKDLFATIYDTKRKESIMTNKQFKSEKVEKHDLMFWVQSDPIAKVLMANKELASSAKLGLFSVGLEEADLNGNSMALFYDFNKGEMEGGISYDMNEKIDKEFGIIFKKKIETDFSAFFPKKHMTNVTLFGLSTKGIGDVLKKRGMDGMADGFLAQSGLKLEEILSGLNGEMAVATYLDPAATDASNAQKVVVAVAFEKPELIDKLIEVANKTGGDLKKEGNRIKSAKMKEGAAVIAGKVLVLSNDMAIIDQIEKGGYKGEEALEAKHYADMSKGWMGAHVDYDQVMTTMGEMTNSPLMGGMAGMGKVFKILAEYNELESSTAAFNTEEAKVMVFLKNKNDNSLKVISRLADKVYQDRGKLRKEFKNIEEGTETADEKKKEM